MHSSRIVRFCLFLLIALATCKGLYHLVSQAWYFFDGAYAGDAKYYWTVGKALLNGFELYGDIFDTKPPGIYLLSALSFWMFDSGTLGFIFNALMVLAYPLLFAGVAYLLAVDLPQTRKRNAVLFSALFGMLLSLYTAFQAQAWQVEWYGAFFASLYALALVSVPHLAILTTCLVLAIGFKEPFALSLIGIALLLLPRKQDFIHRFAKPLGITAVAGVIGLLAFGYADGYFSTYLPSHFGHHLVRSVPLWMRGLFIDIWVKYLWEYSYFFSVLVGILFVEAFVQSRRSGRPIVRAILIIIALYLALTAGNLRGYPVANHFVAVAPLYTALFLLMLKRVIAEGFTSMSRIFMGVMVVTLLTIPMSDGFARYAEILSNREQGSVARREVAEKIDAILDACNVDRYFYVEEKSYMEYMRHSPQNFFVYAGPESIVYYHPLVIEKHLQSFSTAQIVIAHGDAYEIRQQNEEKTISEMTFRYLANQFTITPWSCAEDLETPKGYSVLYRKDPHDMKSFLFKLK
ncbi:MAG: hypothetical protein QF793_01130 [Candidatus Peribacteraceae bacterium]|jgi:hypothetical protein|nr:hypothetical protein [bacterium]MDP6561506.1 hypothetical protein [Candidatus Peribacteraceae bacterium]|tara:strand:- start:19914 stop:21467 length:1554 start_codon:yes stop_codon:yes gene_type:complete